MRVEGYHLYLQAAKYGTYLFALSFIIYAVFHKISCLWILDIASSIKTYFNTRIGKPDSPAFDMLIVSFLSIALSYFFSSIMNKRWPQELAYSHAIENDDFELLLYRAMANDKLVSVTMTKGKVYVGWIVRTFDPCDERKYLRILPALSGYRASENLKVTFTTMYKTVIDSIINSSGSENRQNANLEEEDFELVLAVSEIQSANIFDIEAYIRFQEQGKDRKKNHPSTTSNS